MKAELGPLQDGYGEIRLLPERIDDLWHLSQLITPGDLVFATTLRTTEGTSDKIRPEKREKRPVRLGLRVEKVEFHDYANRLRVAGEIQHGVDVGSHHTFNLDPGYEISVVRGWSREDLARIERAVKASAYEAVHVLALEEGEATLFRIRQYGPEEVTTIRMGSGKGADTDSRPAFHEAVLAALENVTGPLVIAGPGFAKEMFLHYVRTKGNSAAAAAVVETRRSGRGAVQEVIGLGALEKLTGDLQLKREVGLMEELLARLGKGEPVAYGRTEVRKAADAGALETLLVADTVMREPPAVYLMQAAERQRADVVVLSTRFDPGAQLDALGGVAALLRFAVG